MAQPLLIYPGEVGLLAEVNDLLDERHRQVLAALERAGSTEPPPTFDRRVELDGVRVQARALSERQRRAFELREAASWRRVKAAQEVSDEDTRDHALVEATDQLFDERRAYLMQALELVEVDGPRGGTFRLQDFEALFDALERSGLFHAVWQAAHAAQEMPAGKAWRSGRPLASTSSASTATPAQSTGEPHAAVMAGHAGWTGNPPTSPARATPPTPVPGGT